MTLAVAAFIWRKYGIPFVFYSILLFAISILLFYVYLNLEHVWFQTNALNHLYIPFVYVLGPATWLSYHSMLDDSFQLNDRKMLMFLPVALATAAFVMLIVTMPKEFTDTPLSYFQGRKAKMPEVMILVGFAQNFIYYIWIFKNASYLFHFKSLRSDASARMLFGLYVGIGLITAMILMAYTEANILLLEWATWITSLMAVIGYWFSRMSPELFTEIEIAMEINKEEKKAPPKERKTSRIEGLDLKELHLQLIELMTQDKLYMNDNLTLAVLSEELDIKPHQLSEFLNSHLGMNFSRFVNQFRIEKSIKILLENPDASILSVAYECGFNSKATFNAAFQSIKGTSPSRYLEQKRKERIS